MVLLFFSVLTRLPQHPLWEPLVYTVWINLQWRKCKRKKKSYIDIERSTTRSKQIWSIVVIWIDKHFKRITFIPFFDQRLMQLYECFPVFTTLGFFFLFLNFLSKSKCSIRLSSFIWILCLSNFANCKPIGSSYSMKT